MGSTRSSAPQVVGSVADQSHQPRFCQFVQPELSVNNFQGFAGMSLPLDSSRSRFFPTSGSLAKLRDFQHSNVDVDVRQLMSISAVLGFPTL